MYKILEFINMQRAFLNGEIGYDEYSKFTKRKDNLLIQFIFLASFLIVMGYIMGMPLYMMIGCFVVMLYGILLKSKAKTIKQTMFYSFIWAITSFIAITIIAILAVSVLGVYN